MSTKPGIQLLGDEKADPLAKAMPSSGKGERHVLSGGFGESERGGRGGRPQQAFDTTNL